MNMNSPATLTTLITTRFETANGVGRSSWRRRGQALFQHQLMKERRGFRMRNRRLRADSDQAVSVIDRQPGVFRELSRSSTTPHAPVVSGIQLRAVIDQELNDFAPPFVR